MEIFYRIGLTAVIKDINAGTLDKLSLHFEKLSKDI